MNDLLFVAYLLLLSSTSIVVRYLVCFEKIYPGFITSKRGLPYTAWTILFPLLTFLYFIKKHGYGFGGFLIVSHIVLYFIFKFIFTKSVAPPSDISEKEMLNNYIFRDWWAKYLRRG